MSNEVGMLLGATKIQDNAKVLRRNYSRPMGYGL